MFERRLSQVAAEVDRALTGLLDHPRSASGGVPERLAAAMRHAVMAGGKRIRPFLVIESAALFGAGPLLAMPAALALECVHCYSLVHDDLPAMDNDELRRGQPTVWKAFDDWTAILAGDALLTLAFEVLGSAVAIEPTRRLRLVLELASAAGRAGMVGGQCLDLEASKLGRPTSSAEHIERIEDMKTGALFRFACRAGAIVGGATETEADGLTRFGERLGRAFQIADDLIDAEGEAGAAGKATAKDAAAGKATLIALGGVGAARQRLAELEAAAATDLEMFADRAAVLRQALRFAAHRAS